jgi:glycosyltransferase involved in cell wall biosynthesis
MLDDPQTADADVDRPLRIAFLADPGSPHTRRWIDFFLDRGHEIHMLIPAHDVITAAPHPRLRVETLTTWPRVRIRGVGALITAMSLRRALARIRPDVLHAHFLTRYGFTAWLSGFHPYVVTVWGSDVLLVLPASRWRQRIARRALRAAELVTGGSRYMLRAAVAAGARPERTRLIQFGVDTDRFRPGPDPGELRARLGLNGQRVVLSNRTIAPNYRQDIVLEAVARLPADVTVVMTRHAAHADELVAIEFRAADLGIADRVRVIDSVDDDDMPDLYRLADVVVSVPASDGGPVSLLEALAVGRPIVATDLPPVREWLGELDPEALVPVGDAQATATAVEALLRRTAADRAARAERGRAAVIERADYARSMTRMQTLYRELAAGRAIS